VRRIQPLVFGIFFGVLGVVFAWAAPLFAAEPIKISPDDRALDLSRAVEIYNNYGSSFQISTMPGADGIVRRIEVQANSPDASGNWATFTLANTTDEVIDRLLVAPHYRLASSGVLTPDLGAQRIISITPSEGFALDRQTSPDSDVFRLTLNPGSIITMVAELGTPDLPQLYLWEPDSYKDTVNSYTLYRGILLGIAGLLAMLLTILFVVKGTSLFPATAAFAWAVLVYACVDFNFLSKLFAISPGTEPIWRAGAEVALAASLLIFLFAYLHLHRWHYHFSFGALLWLLSLCALGAWAIFDPIHAAGIARASLAATALIGIVLIVYLGARRYDRAIMLIPSWALFVFWLIGAWATVTGRLDNDIVQPALVGGLVLIVLLVAFTVMQHAFSGGAIHQGLFSDLERQALAVMGTGDVVWDWDVLRDRVVTNPDLTHFIGSAAKNLSGQMRNWLPILHSQDRDRFRATLDLVLDARAGRINQTFRLRAGDNQYRWFSLRARPVIGPDGEIIRCVGMLMDITELKRNEERLLHNAVYDNLTGLPNRQIFLDRLQNWCTLARDDENIRPTLLIINFDDFRTINQRHGISVGDSFILAMARRLSRHLKPLDTLCRLSADRFAFLLVSQNDLSKVAAFAVTLKKTLALPVTFSGIDIKLTASIGLLPWLGGESSAEERLNDAILAMYHAKKRGGDRIEPFTPAFRISATGQDCLEQQLQDALNSEKITLVYHPVLRITDGAIVGFEAIAQWLHPTRGTLGIKELITAAENADLVQPLAQFILSTAARDSSILREHFPTKNHFVSVHFPSSQLLRFDLLNTLQSILVRTPLKSRQLQVEILESALIDNPEQAVFLFEKLKNLGVGLMLDRFGAGYASLDYLMRFSFDMIKLDHSLFSGEKKKQKNLLHSLITMAHDLNFEVIADGVETQKTALMLREAHCDYLQSMSFSSPLNFSQTLTLLQEN